MECVTPQGNLASIWGPVPVIHPIGQVAAIAFVRAMRAWKEVRSSREHKALKDDLTEHIFRERGDLLAPYL